MKRIVLAWLALGYGGSAIAQEAPTAPATPAAPAAQISNFRAQHGEGKVTLDPALNRIAEAQAAAMAAKDDLDHSVLAPFGSRVAAAGAERAAENIAYGYDSFSKTLGQWINSPEHRKNLLLHGASRVGVAHAQSAATHRTYWAMEIAGGYERHLVAAARHPAQARAVAKPRHPTAPAACRINLLGLCL
jgi:hypothetical protein